MPRKSRSVNWRARCQSIAPTTDRIDSRSRRRSIDEDNSESIFSSLIPVGHLASEVRPAQPSGNWVRFSLK